MRIVLLGPPGAGKGTQAYRMAERFGLVHLSSGDILRRERESGTELGRNVAAIMDAGRLVPDDVITAVMVNRTTQPDAMAGLLLDGFPRTLQQADALGAALELAGCPITGAVSIDVDDQVIIDRLSGRRTCPMCQRSYHQTHSPPLRADVCDDDGAALQQRDDDKPEVIANRLRVYNENTAPLLDYYERKGLLKQVDGSREIDEVTEELAPVFEHLRNGA